MGAPTRVAEQVVYLPLERLRVAATNPRKTQPQRSPGHGILRASIASQGVLNPLIVIPAGDHFDVVCGYRRLTAARELRLASLPCIVRPMQRLEQLTIGLVDNLNRGHMDPVDVGLALAAMRDEGLTHRQIGERVGRSVFFVSRYLRVAGLPAAMQRKIKRKQLTVNAALGPGEGVPRASIFQADEELQAAWLELRSACIEVGDRSLMLTLQRFAGCWRAFGKAKAEISRSDYVLAEAHSR
jgi:ParB/RepB/Spo0J family partition protein